METANILTRIRFAMRDGGDLAYLYSHETLKELYPENDDSSPDQIFIDTNTTLKIGDKKYKVFDIRTLFRNQLVRMGNAPDYDSYGLDLPSDFNFEITYFLEKIS